jgi:hypothetical protein
MSSIFTRRFAIDATERAVKTVAQAATALLISAGTDLITTDWKGIAAGAGIAGVISLLTSIGSSSVGDEDSASLVE